ncbi:MAG TPA: hypothetical protein VGF94_06095 [Kofleriaceae bacterium]|jgi:hypothetical protein
MRVLALIAAAGCARVPVYVPSQKIIEAAPELRHDGSAVVFVTLGDAGPVDEYTLRLDEPVLVAGVRLTLRGLLDDCPDGPITVDDALRREYPHCLLFREHDVQVSTRGHVERGNLLLGIGAVLVIVGTIALLW